MGSAHDNVSMALFCDFENVALGVRDAKYDKFDIRLVLERLLLKGSIVIKKAYCDWDRYKAFKAGMHEANFELIEIPHVRQSGKNSADIRLVVDALDLCYTKSHLDTFVIISGDSDFSPLVSKLRENAKHVIGVGVKHSTSDLLIANCDEFIFYDDLVREQQRDARRDREQAPAARRSPEDEHRRKEELETRRTRAVEIAVETFDALMAERGDGGKIWASVLKEAIKRRKPDFNETYFGFRAFGNLLEEAQARGLMEVGRDDKSGTYVYRASAERDDRNGAPVSAVSEAEGAAHDDMNGRRDSARHQSRDSGPDSGRDSGRSAAQEGGADNGRPNGRRRGSRGRGAGQPAPAGVAAAEALPSNDHGAPLEDFTRDQGHGSAAPGADSEIFPAPDAAAATGVAPGVSGASAVDAESAAPQKTSRRRTTGRNRAAKQAAPNAAPAPEVVPTPEAAPDTAPASAPRAASRRKSATKPAAGSLAESPVTSVPAPEPASSEPAPAAAAPQSKSPARTAARKRASTGASKSPANGRRVGKKAKTEA